MAEGEADIPPPKMRTRPKVEGSRSSEGMPKTEHKSSETDEVAHHTLLDPKLREGASKAKDEESLRILRDKLADLAEPKIHSSMGRRAKTEPTVHSSMGRRSEKSQEPTIISNIGRRSESKEEPAIVSSMGKPTESPEIRSSMGRRGEAHEVLVTGAETDSPKFETLRPKPQEVKTLSIEGAEIRQASTEHHQDGVAYNAETKTFVVCDGMGGVGMANESKDNFAFALAQAISEQPDISVLAQENKAGAIIERTKQVLLSMGVDFQKDLQSNLESGLISSVGANKDIVMGSTVAAIQKVEGTNKWRVATLGDSSVLVIDESGAIKKGYGEAWQLISQGRTGKDGSAEDPPMGSYIGIGREGGKPFVKYGSRGLDAQFAEIDSLAPGDRIVVVSDAYLQKSPPERLIEDMNKSSEDWKVGASPKGGMYGDDASMIIIKPFEA